MSAAPVIPVAEVRPGDVVRFTEAGARRRVTVLVREVEPLLAGGLLGRRATVADGVAATRGEVRLHLAPAEVELLRRLP